MILTIETKELIKTEYNVFKDQMYNGKSKEERDDLAQFFTPPEISFQLLKAYNVNILSDKIIRDPTCGSGNLLTACLLAGADPDKLYGNDYDADMVITCRKRLVEACLEYRKDLNYSKEELESIFNINIHQGNALQKLCLTEFSQEYNNNYNPKYINDLEYAQGDIETNTGLFGIIKIEFSWQKANTEAEIRYQNKLELDKKKSKQNNKLEQLSLNL